MFLFKIFRWKNFVLTALALAVCLGFACGIYLKSVVRLEDLEGERVFYLDSASSQGLLKDKVSLSDFPRLRGESVRLTKQGDEEEMVRFVVGKYNAEVLFLEKVEGVTSYYCYTDEWADYVLIEGKRVNLHVAVSPSQCVVGAPIIFGGF